MYKTCPLCEGNKVIKKIKKVQVGGSPGYYSYDYFVICPLCKGKGYVYVEEKVPQVPITSAIGQTYTPFLRYKLGEYKPLAIKLTRGMT